MYFLGVRGVFSGYILPSTWRNVIMGRHKHRHRHVHAHKYTHIHKVLRKKQLFLGRDAHLFFLSFLRRNPYQTRFLKGNQTESCLIGRVVHEFGWPVHAITVNHCCTSVFTGVCECMCVCVRMCICMCVFLCFCVEWSCGMSDGVLMLQSHVN